MSEIRLPMIVTDFGEGDHPPALPAARTLQRFLMAASAAIPLRGQVTVLITSDRGIRKLNRRYRDKNRATDVLSFPAAVPKNVAPRNGGRGQTKVAGDLAISIDMAARQALALEHTLATELKVLMLHGLLHLAGFDHEADQGEMANRELALRRKLRLPGGLIERTGKSAKTTQVRNPIHRDRATMHGAPSPAKLVPGPKKPAKKGARA